MKPIPREHWPDWLQRLKMPWRFIAARAEDVNLFCNIYEVTRNHAFHYSTAAHVRRVKTPWPFLFIESKAGDDMATFLVNKVLAACEEEGNRFIRIPRCVLEREPFPIETSMHASTIVEMVRRELRAKKRLTGNQPASKIPTDQLNTFA